jgi:hypothetical protein
MSERMWLAEQLEEARTQRDVLRVRVKELEEVIQTQNGVVVSGTLKLNEARARVAKLEAALEPFADESLWAGPQHEFVTVKLSDCDHARAALKDAPQ